MSVNVIPAIVGGAAVLGAGVEAGRFLTGTRTAITQGGSPWGGAINWWLARRGVIGFGLKETMSGTSGDSIGERWKNVNSVRHAEETVRRMENAVFYQGAKQVGKKIEIGYDNGPDAFRHTGGSALITYRLMRDRGLSSDAAAELLRGLGNAHERDSFLHVFDPEHAKNSGDMDVFNNRVGSRVGREIAVRHATLGAAEIAREADDAVRSLPAPIQDALRALEPGERVVLATVLDGIAAGRSVTMTPLPGVTYRSPEHPDGLLGLHQKPHPSSAGDIYVVGPKGEVVLDSEGRRQVRLDAPHAQGYPQPFAGGAYDSSLPRVKMDLHALRVPRPDDVAQD